MAGVFSGISLRIIVTCPNEKPDVVRKIRMKS
jgi:hypothetical protein